MKNKRSLEDRMRLMAKEPVGKVVVVKRYEHEETRHMVGETGIYAPKREKNNICVKKRRET